MIYIEDKNFINENEIKLINKVLYSESTPWFLQPYAEDKNKFNPLFTHSIIRRPEVRDEGEVFNSNPEHRGIFMHLLTKFCKNNNYKLDEMLRCAINISFWNDTQKCEIHSDHIFPHCQLLICLNDTDPNSETVILDDDKKTELLRVKPKKYKGIYFENKPHYHYYPRSGYRAMLVYTFR